MTTVEQADLSDFLAMRLENLCLLGDDVLTKLGGAVSQSAINSAIALLTGARS
jgi:hypothetical protein